MEVILISSSRLKRLAYKAKRIDAISTAFTETNFKVTDLSLKLKLSLSLLTLNLHLVSVTYPRNDKHNSWAQRDKK